VERVDIVDPDRQPYPLATTANAAITSTAALAIEAQENLALT
jgi:hypothetical protein